PRAYKTLPLTVTDSLLALDADSAANPLLDYYRRHAAVYAATERATGKSFTPKLLLAASGWARGSSIQYDDQFKSVAYGFGYQRFNYGVGLAFTYDLFSGIHRRNKLAIAHFQTQAGNFEVEQQAQSLQTSLAKADAAIAATRDNLAQLPLQLEAAADVYRQKLAQYKAGMVNLIDLTNATYVLYRSQTDYVQTLGDWYLQHVEKAAAAGKLDDFIQQIQN
ncbi:MAG TPA: TolC family protein, partial [Chitinophaga sp.]